MDAGAALSPAVLAPVLAAGLVWAEPGRAQEGKTIVISDLPMAQ